MENSTVQLETRWTLYLGSVGGQRYFSFYQFMSHHQRSGRICPGKHLAHSSLTLTVASVLSTFDLKRKVDENGREIEPKKEYTTNGIR